jgi:hypothetical protein
MTLRDLLRTASVTVATMGTAAIQPACAGIPDMICHFHIERELNPPAFGGPPPIVPRTVYRFASGDLFISSPDRSEYRYGKVVEVETWRWLSGYKTIISTNLAVVPGMTSYTMVHSDVAEVRVGTLLCSKSETKP